MRKRFFVDMAVCILQWKLLLPISSETLYTSNGSSQALPPRNSPSFEERSIRSTKGFVERSKRERVFPFEDVAKRNAGFIVKETNGRHGNI